MHKSVPLNNPPHPTRPPNALLGVHQTDPLAPPDQNIQLYQQIIVEDGISSQKTAKTELTGFAAVATVTTEGVTSSRNGAAAFNTEKYQKFMLNSGSQGQPQLAGSPGSQRNVAFLGIGNSPRNILDQLPQLTLKQKIQRQKQTDNQIETRSFTETKAQQNITETETQKETETETQKETHRNANNTAAQTARNRTKTAAQNRTKTEQTTRNRNRTTTARTARNRNRTKTVKTARNRTKQWCANEHEKSTSNKTTMKRQWSDDGATMSTIWATMSTSNGVMMGRRWDDEKDNDERERQGDYDRTVAGRRWGANKHE